jgi:glutamine amidotransferase
MCRALAYLGPPVLLDDLLYGPDSSLVRQSYEPQLLEILNLGGFGMLAWDPSSHDAERPWIYRSTDLPIYDANLKALAEKMRASCLLAHVRGIQYRADAGFGPHNLHPFHYAGRRWAMAHNGDLYGHTKMRFDLFSRVMPQVRECARGTTDSETVYALVLSELDKLGRDDPDALVAAIQATLHTLSEVRAAHGVDIHSALNLFFSDGHSIVALRYTFDYGRYPLDDLERSAARNQRYLSLWFTRGEAYRCVEGAWSMVGDPNSTDAIAVASEPLTRDVTGWVELPEYGGLLVDRAAKRMKLFEVDR